MMFRLGAIMTVAAAAAPRASEEASEDYNGESRQLRWSWRPKKHRCRGLCATATGNTGGGEFEAAIEAQKKGGKIEWTVKIAKGTLSAGGAACSSYNWHIHARPVAGSGDCGPGQTGGHSDNSLACTGASEENKKCGSLYDCDEIADGSFEKCYAGSYKRRCNMGKYTSIDQPKPYNHFNLALDQQGCEYGDLSGKMGKIDPNTNEVQRFSDSYLEPLSTYADMSVVLHCCTDAGCSPRVACGDFTYRA